MAEKTSMSVLAPDLEDPSSSEGMINVARKLVPYLPIMPNSKKQKTTVFGDQGCFERGAFIANALSTKYYMHFQDITQLGLCVVKRMLRTDWMGWSLCHRNGTRKE